MPTKHRISLAVHDDGPSLLNPEASQGFIARLAQYFDALAGGSKSGKVRVNTGAAQATGTITFSSFADADTVTLNGVTLTGKTSPSGASQWAVGSSDEACANNLVAKINASALDKIVGCLDASRRATVLLSSFVDGDTVTVGGVVFTGKTTPDAGVREQFQIGLTDAVTAAALCDAINRSLKLAKEAPNLVATVSSATVTLNYRGSLTVTNSAHATVASKIVVITCPIPGQIGNLCTLAISAHGSVSAANLASGTEGTETIFAKNSNLV